jgi:hypothetical protein
MLKTTFLNYDGEINIDDVLALALPRHDTVLLVAKIHDLIGTIGGATILEKS